MTDDEKKALAEEVRDINTEKFIEKFSGVNKEAPYRPVLARLAATGHFDNMQAFLEAELRRGTDPRDVIAALMMQFEAILGAFVHGTVHSDSYGQIGKALEMQAHGFARRMQETEAIYELAQAKENGAKIQ